MRPKEPRDASGSDGYVQGFFRVSPLKLGMIGHPLHPIGQPLLQQYLAWQGIWHTMGHVKPDPGEHGESRSIERELKRGSLELIVLHLLSSGEAYGYEIVTKLSDRTGGALEVTDGTLYPVLYRLERGGFVTVRWETPQRSRR